ncbi:DUF86 domain-containing protein [Parafilimonas sp.]|uniref:HepT-like ribonuclease domain-containing protein n=1 Tax=Parafilimonas sp. TaxID=1969739 RepID=UPI0039E65180
MNIQEPADIIITRFKKIPSPEDFIKSDNGLETLDSISMRLQFIGESLKKIEKINKDIFDQYLGMEWKKIINLRDFISHHYDMPNHEIVFDICDNHIPPLQLQVTQIITDLNNG